MEWTNDEVEYLKINYPFGTRATLCSKLNRAFSTIQCKAKRLKIQRQRHNTFDLDFKYFDKIDSNSKAYILGLLWSDGCLTNKDKVISISLIDREPIEYIKKELKYTGPIFTKSYKTKVSKIIKQKYVLRLSSTYLVYALKVLGLHADKSSSITFPKLHKSYNSAFISGIFDGDGYIHMPTLLKKWRTSRKIGFAGNYAMMETIKSILIEKGFPNVMIQKNDKHSTTYRIIYVCKYVELFWKKVYSKAPFRILRKETKFIIDNEIVQNNELLLRRKPRKNLQSI